MKNKPKIIVAGMFDTKYTELEFLAQEVAKAGGDVTTVNNGFGKRVNWTDIRLQDILNEIDVKEEDVFKMSRLEATKVVGEAGAKWIIKQYEEGNVDGIISWAGSMGTTTVTYLMRALPFGLPKLMLTDMASGDVSMWLGNKDIYIVNPTAEQGVNSVTRKQIANAAAAIVAMAKVGEIKAEKERPLMAITGYGCTTPNVNRVKDYWNQRGWDTIVIHAVGTGATMEDLIRSGDISAVVDLTTGELTNAMYGSSNRVPDTWDGIRLTAASDMGIPQIVTPGGCDQAACGPMVTLARYFDDFETGKRKPWKDTKRPYKHNEGVTVMWPTLDETAQISDYFADKLNKTKGPTVFLLPMQGWSAYDQRKEIANEERGWNSDFGDGPQWYPDEENPTWSKRATLMWKLLNERFDKKNPNLDFIVADMNIVDKEFGDLMNLIMKDMLEGRWTKGIYRDFPGVLA